jgi:hypothetical protein
MFPEARAILRMNTYVLAVEEITKQHARFNVGAMAFDELEDCADTLTTWTG